MDNSFKQDWRYAQANREALLTLGAYALYFVWWYVCAYGLGSGDPDDYSYILGLPAEAFPLWVITAALALVTALVFWRGRRQ